MTARHALAAAALLAAPGLAQAAPDAALIRVRLAPDRALGAELVADTDGDGRADKVTTFLDDLNCPTGFQFYKDGVLVMQAPDFWFVRDTDGDGRIDQHEIVSEVDSARTLAVESEDQISGNAAVYRTVLIDAETGETLGAVRIAEAALTTDSLPDAASPSSTLSFTQAMLEAERFYAGDAHEIRSFVGLETPLLAGDDTLSGDGAAATTVWLREFDTLIGPRVINDEVAELQADWTLGTDGSAAQGAAGQGTTLDAPMPLDIDGVYTIDLSWLNPTYGYNALQPPVIGLDPELDFSYTYEAPRLVVWDFTQDTGFNYTFSGSSTWELGGGLDTGLADPYSNYDLYNDYAYDLYGLGSLFTVGQGGYSSGLGGGFSLDLGGGSDFSVGDYGPVVLDLDGDGIELVAAGDSRAWYDLDGHGARFHTGWVGADDALLAIDDNGDGEISSGREIAFSLYTEADETDTDMEALATVFDSNADGRLDFNDERYADFRLWQDANGNGESDAGEVRTLAEAGIVSVDLTPVKVDYRSGGNRLLGFSTYEKADGGTGWAGDVSFGFEGDGYATSVENGYLRVGAREMVLVETARR